MESVSNPPHRHDCHAGLLVVMNDCMLRRHQSLIART